VTSPYRSILCRDVINVPRVISARLIIARLKVVVGIIGVIAQCYFSVLHETKRNLFVNLLLGEEEPRDISRFIDFIYRLQ
jgi:hypothetical protein